MSRTCRADIIQQEAEQAILIGALRDHGGLHADDLAERLSRCRVDREALRSWGGRPDQAPLSGQRYRCRRVCCWSCRQGRIHGVAAKGAARFDSADNDYCSIVTIADSVTGDLNEVHQRVITIARRFRDRRDAMVRSAGLRWATVEAIGHVELDPYWSEDISAALAPDQKALIPTLPVLARSAHGPLWVLRPHLAVRHDGIDRGRVAEALQRQWPGVGRVHVGEFYEHQLPVENAGSIISYSAKHQQVMDAGFVSERWPIALQVSYWAWLHSLGRALQPLRVSVKPRRSTLASKPAQVAVAKLIPLEPMPFILP